MKLLTRIGPTGIIGVVLLSLIVLTAASAGVLFPGDPFAMVGQPYARPLQDGFLLGTDTLGRDIAAGIAYGARVSLMIGFVTTVIIIALGALIGGIAGYFGGAVDDVLMRLTEFFQTIPSFIFAIVVVAILQPSIQAIVISIAIVSWPPLARLVRAEFMSLRSRDFVTASVAMGMGDPRIILTQILPNALSPVIVAGSLMVATAILFESGLSFLGLGDPNVMSWGLMIGAGRVALRSAWWMVTFPGLAILVTVLAINLVGDALNDLLNPRRTQS
jgi:peptide/nickel transport system permease protein